MLILMDLDAPRKSIEKVTKKVSELGCTPHEIPGQSKIAIGITGPTASLDEDDFVLMDDVERVVRVTSKYKLVSREMKSENTLVDVRGRSFGGEELGIIAGPCSVESRDQIFEIAGRLHEMGIGFLRGGAFKPRSSPYAFRGLKEKGLEYLADVKKEFGIRIVTELLNTTELEAVAEVADIIQIGARNMQNFGLLEEAGSTGKPVLLKRGMSATVEDLLLSAEYIVSQNNYNVILCERGIRTFETSTRNTLDLNSVPVIKHGSHLPVIVDPSHGTGLRDKVAPMSLAAVAAGADGLIIEVHHKPQEALSDGYQSVTPEQFRELLDKINQIAPVVGKRGINKEEKHAV